MKYHSFFRRLCTALLLLCIACLSGTALCENFVPAPSSVIVQFDRTAAEGWTPGYGLSAPGVLLEMSHAEAMLSITALEKNSLTPNKYLDEHLDRAGQTLSVINAQITAWKDPFDGDGQLLSFSYTYPDGDEVHLARIYAASRGDMLLELSIDTWGEEAQPLMDSACSVFIEKGFSLLACVQPLEIIATLTDAIEDSSGRTMICLSSPSETQQRVSTYYPLSENAVVLFPNPDDPSLLYPVAVNMTALIDAVLTYEENSDGPAVFYCIIEDQQIVYMEYSLLVH
jgi:hypothetical protein